MKKPGFFFCYTWMMNYWYFIGWDKKQFTKYCEKHFDHTPEFHSETVKGKLIEVHNDKGTKMLIWTQDKKDLPSLVHECVHAAHFTLALKGFKPDFYNDEPVTYLVQSIFTHAMKYTGVKL